MGHIYERGLGVPADKGIALHWYQLSAEQGYQLGAQNLARLRAQMGGPSEGAPLPHHLPPFHDIAPETSPAPAGRNAPDLKPTRGVTAIAGAAGRSG
jgi:TPR repeat protein